MAELRVRLHSQEGMDALGGWQSHQWAEVPAELAACYLSGGLKKIRRLAEGYFGYRFSPASKRVRGLWHAGEPTLRLRLLRLPLVHLGRLRVAATADIFRGYMEILDGDMVSPAAIAVPQPWPADMPWVAPSAGELRVQAEHEHPPYLGSFEIRVQRTAQGCTLHTILQDFPPVGSGLRGWIWSQPWQPMKRAPNLDYLQKELQATARAASHTLRFEIEDHPGLPERLHAIYAQGHLSPA